MNLERLAILRENSDLTKVAMAKIIGVSYTSIYDFETMRIIIPLERLNKYANYFNVSLDYLFNLTDKPDIEIINKKLDAKLIGQRLKQWRKENKITQEKLASILNTVHSAISNYEKGKRLILTAYVYQICSKYHISADYLCGRTNAKEIK